MTFHPEPTSHDDGWTQAPQSVSHEAPPVPFVAAPDNGVVPGQTPSPQVNQFGLPVTPGASAWDDGGAEGRAAAQFNHSGTGYESRLAEVNAQGRVNMEYNHFGHYSLGLGIAAALLTLLMYVPGGVSFFIPVGLAIPAIFFGLRGWNAGVRGFANNQRIAMAGGLLGVGALVGTVVFIAVTAFAVAEVIENAPV